MSSVRGACPAPAADEAARLVRIRLRAAADPSRASGQQAYMKSAMPFLGVRVPEARRIARTVVREAGIVEPAVLQEIAENLWESARHREERYAAMAVLSSPPLRGDTSTVPLIERMVREGAWWDITDELAHRLADLHDASPADTAALVRRWSTDGDRWIRRLAVLSQLGRRARVDTDVLAAVIDVNARDPDFFLRKAIGWALRDYARTDPAWVRHFLATRELSPLSRREASKHL